MRSRVLTRRVTSTSEQYRRFAHDLTATISSSVCAVRSRDSSGGGRPPRPVVATAELSRTLSDSLTGPAPSGGAATSRLCRCCPNPHAALGTGVFRPSMEHRLEPGGSGPGVHGAPTDESVRNSWVGLPLPAGRPRGRSTATGGDAAGTRSGSSFVERITVNTGTVLSRLPAACAPAGCPGLAHRPTDGPDGAQSP